MGSSFGLAITTIIFNSVLTKESRAAGVAVNKSGTNAPYGAQEDAYKAAMWGGFAFGVLGALLAALEAVVRLPGGASASTSTSRLRVEADDDDGDAEGAVRFSVAPPAARPGSPRFSFIVGAADDTDTDAL